MEGKTNHCMICGREVRSTRKTCCSRECSKERYYRSHPHYRPVRVSSRCMQCTSEFQGPSNKKYCSRECAREAWLRKNDNVLRASKFVQCLQCGRQFRQSPRYKYCSVQCKNAFYLTHYFHHEPKPSEEKKCKGCPRVFIGRPNRMFCGGQCASRYKKVGKAHEESEKPPRPLLSKTEEVPIEGKDDLIGTVPYIPSGCYVYGWYHDLMDLPFYIGKGVGKRGWDRHYLSGKVRAHCEKYRSLKTRVEIYRQNLTEEGALLVESVLIQVFTKLGAPLSNQVGGMTRQEVPPLSS